MATELPDGWRDELPEEIKISGVLDDIKSIDQMATMVVNGRKLQSRSVSIPGEDASAEKKDEFLKDLQSKVTDLVYVGEGADMSNVYDRMGRPKDHTEYDLPDLPDPLKESFSALSSKAHEAGLSSAQMKVVAESLLTDYSEAAGKNQITLDGEIDKLKKEWGDSASTKQAAAATFATQAGFTDDFSGAIKSGSLGAENMLAFDKMMAGFESPGPRIGDEPGAAGDTTLTPNEAETKLDEIMGNKEHAYWDSSNGAHKSAVDKVIELTRMADAGKTRSESEQFRDALMGNG